MSTMGSFTDRDDEGVLLLDILIGIALLALIILLAVQTVSGLRARAYKAGAENDAQQISLSVEVAATREVGIVSASNAELSGPDAANPYPDVNITTGNVASVTAAGEEYVVCVTHTSGAWAEFDSATGRYRSGASSSEGGIPCTVTS